MSETKADAPRSRGHKWLRWLAVGSALVAWALWQRWQRYLEKQAYPPPVRETPTPPQEPEAPAHAAEGLKPETQREAVAFGAEAPPDDLTRIEGVGPKVASVLADAGVTTFAQLAEAEVETLREILRDAGLQFMNPTTWPEQAALAAKEEWEQLKRVQQELKGGKRT
ncbi:MAG: DUF4332 domain-containing protein [Anaerolineae bacterium]